MQYKVGATRTLVGKDGWPVAVFQEVPVPGAIECILEGVHPGNLGDLPLARTAFCSKRWVWGLPTS